MLYLYLNVLNVTLLYIVTFLRMVQFLSDLHVQKAIIWQILNMVENIYRNDGEFKD